MKDRVLVLTCEHGGNHIPKQWKPLVSIPKDVLESHRGWDPGALELFHELEKIDHVGSYHNTTTRLLIEFNRSLGHRRLFSEYALDLADEVKCRLIEDLYRPYREAVSRAIERHYKKGTTVWHISVHTFTPVLDGVERTAEIGLLYDPQRSGEKHFATNWQEALKASLGSGYRVRMNYPYRGTADGFVTALRKSFPSDRYVGIEIEVNQGLRAKPTAWRMIKEALRSSLKGLKGEK